MDNKLLNRQLVFHVQCNVEINDYVGHHIFSGMIVTLRELSNMKARISSGSGNDLMTLVADLRKDSTFTIDVFTDEDNNLLDIFYQDARMRSLYASFPR